MKKAIIILQPVFFLLLSASVFAHGNMQSMLPDDDTTATLSISEAKESLKDHSFLYFDVTHLNDSISRCGGKAPYFLDWIFKNVKGLNGTYGLLENHVRTMNPEADELFDPEGPSFKHRPIIWLVDDKFLALTGTRSRNVKYKARSAYEKDLTLILSRVSKVYISKTDNVWAPWFEYDNLSDIRPVTIFIYTCY